MKTLLLMRHAKSSWDDAGTPDHDRPLNKRGLRDAPRMGALIERERIVPDRILSSTAARAKATAEAVAAACGFGGVIRFERGLYGADPGEILAWVRGEPDDAQCLLVVGHNPGMEDLASALAGGVEAMPTAAIARFRFETGSWREAGRGAPHALEAVWRPKEMEE